MICQTKTLELRSLISWKIANKIRAKLYPYISPCLDDIHFKKTFIYVIKTMKKVIKNSSQFKINQVAYNYMYRFGLLVLLFLIKPPLFFNEEFEEKGSFAGIEP